MFSGEYARAVPRVPRGLHQPQALALVLLLVRQTWEGPVPWPWWVRLWPVSHGCCVVVLIGVVKAAQGHRNVALPKTHHSA